MNNEIRKTDLKGNFLSSFFNHYFRDDFLPSFFKEEFPATNVKESKNAFNLELSVPGFGKEDLSIEIDKNVLHIWAKKEEKKEDKDENENIIHQEFTSSSFARSFSLPENVDTENIVAEQTDGVLKITLPKLEKALEDKVKKIDIK